jgi:hypothetical protein
MGIETTERLPQVITEDLSKAIGGALEEMSGSFYQIAAQKDHQKAIAERMKEKHDIPTKDFMKMAKLYHSASLVQKAAEDEEFYDFCQAVFSQIGAPGIEHK